jgi:GH35 family endo-1,4-beta-xylanase
MKMKIFGFFAGALALVLCGCASVPDVADKRAQGDGPAIPAGAVELLGDAKMVPTKPRAEQGSFTTGEVLRVTSLGKLEKSYELAVNKSFTGAIAKDQVCLFVIRARCVDGGPMNGKAKVTAAVQNTKNYPAGALWRDVYIGREWTTHYFAFAAGNEIPAGAGVAKLAFGNGTQTVEVADFRLYKFPAGFEMFNAPRMPATYDGRAADAAWRKEADERIAKLRQGAMTVRVTDSNGVAVAGAKVRVAMKRHAFGFGSSVDVNMISGLTDKPSPEDQARYRAVTDELFSRIVPENGLRVGNIEAEPNPAKPWEADSRRRTGVAVQWTLQWAQDRKMTTRGHYLTWGYLEPWASDIVKKDGPQGLLNRYDRHFAFVLPFCAPYVSEWDALNHPVPFVEADALYKVVGPDVYPDLYKKMRPQTDKLLFVNEDTFNPERTDGFEKHVRHMIANGATPDGCGFQSHYHDGEIPGIEAVWKTWNRFAPLVKNLTVTEYDFQSLDDQLHADHMRDMLTLAFSHPQMTGFVIWGFWEKRHWKPTAAMFKADWTERPAVKAWRDLVKTKWWTNAELTTDASGNATLPAYFGWYDLTLEHAGQTKTLLVNHATAGSKPVLKLP